MEDAVVNAIIGAGGYAILCWLMMKELSAEREAHRKEVQALSECISANTAAVTALREHLAGKE